SRCHVLAKRGPSTYGSRSLSGLQQQFSDDLAAFEQRLGAAGLGERQAVVDQRAGAGGGGSWISGRMRPAARWSNSTVIAAARMSGRSSKLWIVKKRTAGLLAELARIAVTGVGRAVEAAVGDHHPERRQHIEIAAKALAADRVEDQIGAAASRKLAHAGDDILAAVVDRVLRAKSKDRSGLLLRAGDADHLQAGDQRQLHRGAADATRRGVDEHPFRLDPARRSVQHVIGDLIIRKAR